jgi:hypothetical protein
LNEATFKRLVNVLLGASGRSGRRGGTVTSGTDLLGRVVVPASQMAGVQRALSELDPAVAPFERWARYLRRDGDGRLTLDAGKLVERVLERAHMSTFRERVESRMVEAAAEASTTPELWVRGHDYVTILLKILNSPWGSRFADTNIRRLSEDGMARVLLTTVPPVVWRGTELVATLRAAFR